MHYSKYAYPCVFVVYCSWFHNHSLLCHIHERIYVSAYFHVPRILHAQHTWHMPSYPTYLFFFSPCIPLSLRPRGQRRFFPPGFWFCFIIEFPCTQILRIRIDSGLTQFSACLCLCGNGFCLFWIFWGVALVVSHSFLVPPTSPPTSSCRTGWQSGTHISKRKQFVSHEIIFPAIPIFKIDHCSFFLLLHQNHIMNKLFNSPCLLRGWSVQLHLFINPLVLHTYSSIALVALLTRKQLKEMKQHAYDDSILRPCH